MLLSRRLIAIRALVCGCIVIIVLLLLVRPVYAAFAAVGFITAVMMRGAITVFRPRPALGQALSELWVAGILSAAAMFAVVLLIEGSWLVRLALGFATMGVAALLYRHVRKSQKWRRVAVEFAVISLLFAAHIYYALRAGAPPVKTVRYLGTLASDNHRWSVNHNIVLTNVDPSDLGQRGVIQDYERLRDVLQSCGWKEEVQLHFARTQEQRVSARWFPLMTTNAIGFPLMRCNDLIFQSAEDSILTVYAPPHVISRTSPQPKSRSEDLSGNIETITIPVAFGWDRTPSAQIEVVAPFLQNSIGAWLITGAAWEPLKWLLLAVCGIFSEQIRKSVLTPFVRRLFRILRLPFNDENIPQADSSER